MRHHSRAKGARRLLAGVALPLVAALVGIAPSIAPAAVITGISDQNAASWASSGARTYFDAMGSGVTSMRYNLPWNAATTDARAGDAFDVWLNTVRALGKTPLVSIDLAAGSAPPSLRAYEAAVSAILSRWQTVRLFTAWNEPNHSRRGDGTVEPNPVNDATLAADYYIALRALCPDCTVVAGDFNDDDGDMTTYLPAYKARLAARGITPEVWAFHPYRAVNRGEAGELNTFLSQTGTADVWFTEIGGQVCVPPRPGSGAAGRYNGERYQQDAGQRLKSFAANPRVKRVYWYQFTSGQDPAGCQTARGAWDTALLGPDNVPRPIYADFFTVQPGTAESNYIATIGGDGAVWLKYGLPGGTWFPQLGADPQTPRDVELDFNRLAVVRGDGSVWLRDGLPGLGWHQLFGPEFNAREVEIDGSNLAVVAGDGSVWIKQGLPGGGLEKIAGPEFAARSISLDGNRLAIASGDGAVWLKDGLPGGGFSLMFGPEFDTRVVSLSGDRVAVAAGNGSTWLKEGLPGGPLLEMGGPPLGTRDAVLRGGRLAISTGDGAVYVRDVPSGPWLLMFGTEFNAADIDMSGDQIAVINGNSWTTWLKSGLPGGPINLMGGPEFNARKLSLR